MNDLPKLYYCNVGKCVYDTHGKVYEIKEHGNWKFMNFDNKKIGGLFNQFPCIAMEYLIYRRITKKNISAEEYKKLTHD